MAQTPTIPLSALDGRNGFRFDGAADEAFSAGSGRPVRRAGDINGDGIDDLIAGAPGASNSTGRSYVIFGGRSDYPATLALSTLDGAQGFALWGEAAYDGFGNVVSSAGDIDGDGLDDVLVGGPTADAQGLDNSGRGYVVFGSTAPFVSPLPVSGLNGANGFTLDGEFTSDFVGAAVSTAGDLNGDGFDDLAIGSVGTSDYGSPRTHVLFGRSAPFAANLPLSSLDGSTGFTLRGSGHAIDLAGDVNHDGHQRGDRTGQLRLRPHSHHRAGWIPGDDPQRARQHHRPAGDGAAAVS